MEKDEKQKENEDNKASLIVGIIMCFCGLPFVGIILIALYVAKRIKPANQSKAEEQKGVNRNLGRCPYCGANLKENSNKCDYCGSNLSSK